MTQHIALNRGPFHRRLARIIDDPLIHALDRIFTAVVAGMIVFFAAMILSGIVLFISGVSKDAVHENRLVLYGVSGVVAMSVATVSLTKNIRATRVVFEITLFIAELF